MEQSTKRAFCENKAHIYGYLNTVSGPFGSGEKKTFFLHVADVETYKDKDNNEFKRANNHSVKVITDDAKCIEKLTELQKDCEANKVMRNDQSIPDKEKKYKTHWAAVDGGLASSAPKKNDESEEAPEVLFSPSFIVTNMDNIRFDKRITELDKKLPNFIEFSGNMTEPKYSKGDEFADFGVGMNRTYTDKNGKEHEDIQFINVQVSKAYRPKTFEAIKNGKLGKGDFIKVSGIIREENYENDKGQIVNTTRVHAEKVDLKIKKTEKVDQTESVKNEAKPAETPKATATNAKKVEHKKGRTF